MGNALPLRDDYDAAGLRKLARRCRDDRQSCRLLAIASVYEGMNRADAARKNITILLLPSRSPELNPVENIWQYLRQNWLSNRVFDDYEAILDAGCEAWRRLTRQPDVIKSIGMRKWAHNGQS